MKVKILIFLTLLSSLAHATVSSDMEQFINKLGYQGNVTSPEVWKSQAAGNYGGGSLFSRNTVKSYQLVHLELPDYHSGCGGIDLYTGSFSFLKGDQLIELGKQVMSSAGAYAVDLMLETTVPSMKSVRDYLQTLEQMANKSAINSCEASKALVGGIWPKTEASQKKICSDVAVNNDVLTDYTRARMQCETNQFDEVMETAKKDNKYKEQVVLNKNIVWDAMKKDASLANDNELSEFIMNLTGTIIVDKKGNPTFVPSITNSQDVLKAFIGDGKTEVKIKIKKCSNFDGANNCLSIRDGELTIGPNKSLTAKINRIALSMVDKIQKEGLDSSSSFSEEEKKFLSMTHFPILKFAEVIGQDGGGTNNIEITEYSTIIAQDIFQQYLSEILHTIKEGVANSQIQEDLLTKVLAKIQEAQISVQKIDPFVGRKISQKYQLLSRIKQVEKSLSASIGAELKG